MFDFINESKFLSLRKNNEELQKEVADLKQRLDAALVVIKDINNSIGKGPFAFDFKKMNVFSIERNINANKPCTIIGYILKEPKEDSDGSKDVVREWYFYCDEDAHKKLVKEFESSRK